MATQQSAKGESQSGYVLAEVRLNAEDSIESIKYFVIAENKYVEMPFGIYFNRYRNLIKFRNAILVENPNFHNQQFFRARTWRDKHTFKKVGGHDGSTDFGSTQVKSETQKGQINGRGCSDISDRNGTEDREMSAVDSGRNNGNDLFQRQLAKRYSQPVNPSFIIRNVKRADTINPRVFKGLFSKARNNLEPDIRWFVSVRNTSELKKFDCLVFNDENTNFPMGYVAVNKTTGDIGALLRDKACEVPQFTLNALANVIIRGGNKLDCYSYPDKGLGYIYAKHGFMPVCRVRFDETKSERAVRTKVGRPDIVMFFLIEVGNPKDYINDYVENVKRGLYPTYDQYTYVPYVEELPTYYQYGFNKGFDEYGIGLYIRDCMLEKWQTLRDKYKGRECLFIQEQLLKK